MKKTLYFIIFLIVIIQFIRPRENVAEQLSENDITAELNVPSEIQEILKTSCYDCHSNNTKYPWYNQVAPISWLIANHVNEGKKHLNFSEWKRYNFSQKKHILDEMEEVLENNKMPLKSYLLMYHDGKITDQERQYLLEWIAAEKMKIN
ncbi:MAG: heme-binding domain-containing protein [Flavobacteriaceae bacterium]|nr:heme-binding domain-containing protein [Flavobacteriaceae bacterium]